MFMGARTMTPKQIKKELVQTRAYFSLGLPRLYADYEAKITAVDKLDEMVDFVVSFLKIPKERIQLEWRPSMESEYPDSIWIEVIFDTAEEAKVIHDDTDMGITGQLEKKFPIESQSVSLNAEFR
jgi:hypothetical protein